MYGLLVVEVGATLKRIASCLTAKWKHTYSRTCGYVKSSADINLVCFTYHCIHGSQVTAHKISVQRPQWEDGAVLHLLR